MTRNNNKNKQKDKPNLKQQLQPQKQQQQKKKKKVNKKNFTTQTNNDNKPMELGESLFWKLFKNIYLKRKILSMLSFGNLKIGNYKYEQIKSVDWLLCNGYIELLKYKVSRREHLTNFYELQNTFSCFFKPSSLVPLIKRPPLKSIFNEIQNDYSFYSLLFKVNPENFIHTPPNQQWYSLEEEFDYSIGGNNSFKTMLDYSINQSIKYDNISSFSVLVNEYNYIPTCDLFYWSLGYGSFKIAKFIYKHLKLSKLKNDIVVKAWKNSTFIKSSLGEESPKDYKLLIKVVQFLIVDLNLIPPKEINKIKEDIFSVDLKSITVSDLFDICITISMVLEETHLFDDYLKAIKNKEIRDKYMGFTGLLQNYLPNPSIDFIDKQQLITMKANQSDNSLSSLVYSTSSDNETVESLYKMALTFTNYSTNYQDNFIFFICKYQNDYSLNYLSTEEYILSIPFEFGSFDKIPTPTIGKSPKLPNSILFKYCINDKSKDIQFIEMAIKDIKENGNNPKIKPLNLIEMLLTIDRLDLIKMVINSTIGILTEFDLIPINLLQQIKSLSTFDYFYQIKSDTSDRFTFEKCLKIGNGLNLMNHIKTNQKELYKQLQESTFNSNQGLYDYSMESLLFLYENISDFIHCYKSIEIWTRWNYFEFTLDQFIQLVNCTPINEKYSYHCGSTSDYNELHRVLKDQLTYIGIDSKISHLLWNEAFDRYDHKSTLQQLHWVKTNRSYDLLSGRCDLNYGNSIGDTKVNSIDTETLLSLYSYHIGKFNLKDIGQNFIKFNYSNSLDNYRNNQLFYRIRNLIAKHDNVQLLEPLLKTITISDVCDDRQFFEKFITPLLLISVRYGSMKIFNHLKSNYPWIFSSFINSDNSITEYKNGKREHYIRNLFYYVSETSSYHYNNIQIINLIKNGLFKEFPEIK